MLSYRGPQVLIFKAFVDIKANVICCRAPRAHFGPAHLRSAKQRKLTSLRVVFNLLSGRIKENPNAQPTNTKMSQTFQWSNSDFRASVSL